jgi:DNA-directed RNA polymerase subunit RPC12/RpoP
MLTCVLYRHLRCPSGHALMHYNFVHFDNVYRCDHCFNQFENSKQRSHHCPTCPYDLCPSCSDEHPSTPPFQVSSVLKCSNGHALAKYFSVYGGNRYNCTSCGKRYNNVQFKSYHCKFCAYDLCAVCSDEHPNTIPMQYSNTLRCRSGHGLAQYASIYGHGGYRCDECLREFNNSAVRAWHCKTCGYDQCPECSVVGNRAIEVA